MKEKIQTVLRSVWSRIPLKSRWFRIGLPIALILLVVVRSCAPSDEILYETVFAQKGEVESTISVVGSVIPEEEMKLSFQVQGKVKEILVEEGQVVGTGAVLVRLDDLEYREQMMRDQATLDTAIAQFLKAVEGLRPEDRRVLEANVGTTKKNLENARTALASAKNTAQAETRQAEVALETAKELYETTKRTNDLVNTEEINAFENLVSNGRRSFEATIRSNEENIATAAARVREAEVAVQNAQKNLTTNTPIQEQNLTKAQEDAFYGAVSHLNEVDRTLRTINDIITVEEWNRGQNQVYRPLLGVKKLNSYNKTLDQYYLLKDAYTQNKDLFLITNRTLIYEEIVSKLETLKGVLDLAFETLDVTQDMLLNSITGIEFTQASLDAFKTSILLQKEKITLSLSSIASILKTVESYQLQKVSSLTSLENTQDSATEALNTAKKNLDTAKAQADERMISAKNALLQAEDNLGKALANVSNKDISVLNAYNALLNAERNLESVRARTQSQIQAAENTLNTADAQVSAGVADLFAKTAPLRDLDMQIQEAAVRQAEAVVEISKARVDYAELKAPKEGRITEIHVKTGEQVNTATIVITMMSVDVDTIEANVSETDIGKVFIGQRAVMDFDAFDQDKIYEGNVISIAPDRTSLDGVIYYKTKVRFDQGQHPENQIRTGMTANLKIVVDGATSVLSLPRSALKEERTNGAVKFYVEVLKNNAPERRDVEVGIRGDQSVEIRGGVTETDEVILFTRTDE